MIRHCLTGRQVVTQLALLALAAALAGCGIRGQPQPPLVVLPANIMDLSAVRLGDEIHVEFAVPEANADGSTPPDIARVDLYAVTTLPEPGATPPGLAEWLEDADPVFSFDVVVPPEPGEEPEELPPGLEVYAPGALVTVVEPLTPDIAEPVDIATDDDEEEEDRDDEDEAVEAPKLAGPLVSPPLPRAPRRTYLAVAVSRRGRESQAGEGTSVPVQPAPEPPGKPVLTYTETAITVAWTAPASARLPVQRPPPADSETDAEGDAEAAPVPDAPADPDPILESTTLLPPQTPSRYDVYDVTPPPAETEAEAGAADEAEEDADEAGADGDEPDAPESRVPQPLNDQPLTALSHDGVEMTLGGERCFVVRTVDEADPADGLSLSSAASETTCVQLVDTFPPVAPTDLIAVAGAGAISLTWTASTADDVVGYRVLRGSDPEAELEALTPEPLTVTNYRDTTVEAGARYVYAVQAVDGADPPNFSEASEPVTEQAP